MRESAQLLERVLALDLAREFHPSLPPSAEFQLVLVKKRVKCLPDLVPDAFRGVKHPGCLLSHNGSLCEYRAEQHASEQNEERRCPRSERCKRVISG